MKNVLITGASRGIGKAVADEFLRHGWSVTGTSTTGDARTAATGISLHRLNLAEPGSIREFSEKITARGTGIDVLVNNAGIARDRRGPELPIDILRATLEVNLVGLIDLTERLLPVIVDGGHIINISSGLASLSGDGPGAYSPAYSISKAALNMYTRVLAVRLGARKITVSSVDPGWVRTDMGGAGAPRDPSEPAAELYALVHAGVESGLFWHHGKKRSW